MSAETLPTFTPWQPSSHLLDPGTGSDSQEQLSTEAPADELRTITLADLHSPPVERTLLGRMVPLAKASVMYGPTGVGKSALLAQLVFAVASGAESLFGLPVSVHGPVLVVSAEDSFDDWVRKASAVNIGTEADVESALENVRVLDLADGVARLTEEAIVQTGTSKRRVHRPSELADRIIAYAKRLGAVLLVVETTSRFASGESNEDFSELQSALGRIARLTGAALLVSHHQTKAAVREGDSSLESARGGGSFVGNARNALALVPADSKLAGQLADRFAPEDVFELHHSKSTSSTRRENSLMLVRVGTPSGAVFSLPDDVEASAEQLASAKARKEKASAREADELRRLFTLCEEILSTRKTLSRSHLVDKRHNELGMSKSRAGDLVDRAVTLGILREGSRTKRGVRLVLGTDPRPPITETLRATAAPTA